MKKIIFTLIVSISLAKVSNAQIFAGGSVGYAHNSGKTGDVKQATTNSFSVAPMIGYSINDKLSVGLQANVFSSTENNNIDPKNTIKSNFGWGVTPFVKYAFYTVQKFSVYAQANLAITGNTSTTKLGSDKTAGENAFTLGCNIAPGIQYSLSDKISLFANLHFLNVNFTTTTRKNTVGTEVKKTDNSFNFGANTNNVFNTGNIQVGFYVNL